MRLGVFDLNSSSPPLPLPFLEEEKKNCYREVLRCWLVLGEGVTFWPGHGVRGVKADWLAGISLTKSG